MYTLYTIYILNTLFIVDIAHFSLSCGACAGIVLSHCSIPIVLGNSLKTLRKTIRPDANCPGQLEMMTITNEDDYQ